MSNAALQMILRDHGARWLMASVIGGYSEGLRLMGNKCWHEAPFNERGDQVSYPYGATMQPVDFFTDTLTFARFSRGRSAAHAIWKRSDGREVVMFLADFAHVVGFMREGRIEDSVWRYVKRGENYGVAYA